MKSLKLLAIAMSLLVAGSAFAQPATPVVTERQQNQKARIAEGVKSGELTRREAAKLRAEQRAIRAEKPGSVRVRISFVASIGVAPRAVHAPMQIEQNHAAEAENRCDGA